MYGDIQSHILRRSHVYRVGLTFLDDGIGGISGSILVSLRRLVSLVCFPVQLLLVIFARVFFFRLHFFGIHFRVADATALWESERIEKVSLAVALRDPVGVVLFHLVMGRQTRSSADENESLKYDITRVAET